MSSLANNIIIAGVLLALSVFLFLRGIVKKNLQIFIWSVALFLAACAVGVYVVFVYVKDNIHHIG